MRKLQMDEEQATFKEIKDRQIPVVVGVTAGHRNLRGQDREVSERIFPYEN
jgi:hypothetical protein